MKFKWTAVLPLCMLSSTQNNHLTSARFPDKNTNRWWALGILLLHTAACHSWACHESGFLALLQEETSGLMSDCWKTSPTLTPLFLNPQKTFSRPKGTLKNMLFKGENLNQWVEGTGKADVRVWPRKAFPVRAAQTSCGLSILRMPGSLRSPCPGDGWGRRTTGQGFCVQWGGTWKTASNQDSRIPNYLKGRNPV